VASIGKNIMTGKTLGASQKFLLLLIVGFLLIFLGVIMLIFTAIIFGQEPTNFGVIVFIGPVPIIIGSGPEAPLIVLFAIVLAVLSVIIFLIMHKEMKSKVDKGFFSLLFLFRHKMHVRKLKLKLQMLRPLGYT